MSGQRSLIALIFAALLAATIAVNIWNLVISVTDLDNTCDNHLDDYFIGSIVASAVTIAAYVVIAYKFYYYYFRGIIPVVLTWFYYFSIATWLFTLAWAIVGEIWYHKYAACNLGIENDIRKSLDILWYTVAAGVAAVILTELFTRSAYFSTTSTTATTATTATTQAPLTSIATKRQAEPVATSGYVA